MYIQDPTSPPCLSQESILRHYYIITLIHQYDTCLKIPPNFHIITLLLSYIIILSADRLTLLTPPTSWSCIKLPTNYYIIALLHYCIHDIMGIGYLPPHPHPLTIYDYHLLSIWFLCQILCILKNLVGVPPPSH